LDKVVVPEAWTFVRGGKSSLDTPLYRYPSMPLAAQVLAVVGLGIARSALDQMIALAGGRTSITGQPTLADRPYVQTDIAKAEAALRSARAFFYEITEEAYATLVAGDELSVETRALLRLASTNAARVGADITLDIYRMAGTTGVFANHWIAHLMQDAQVIPQHAFLADTTWQNAGKVLLGLESPPGYP
ncbi:acyl-CoA dehydrogenase family protein, partial [Rhizorhabdus wittichii]